MKITFYGAAREVTGSCFLVETATCRFLVECGMNQGGHDASARNHQPFAFAASSIDFVLLTHAHIDHSGLLPKLTKAGFKGAIHTTIATTDLLRVMLLDSAHIQENDYERAMRHAKTSHDRNEVMPPLYTHKDAEDCLSQVKSHDYDQPVIPNQGVRCVFRDAGHILGSAIIEVWLTEQGKTIKLVFSGDLGQPGRPIVRDPTIIEEADILVIESTYGNRIHQDMAAIEAELIDAIDCTLNDKGGNVIIPAFAVGRTQEVLYHLHRLSRAGHLHDLKVIVDSPMATEVTRITQQHMNLFDEATKNLAGWHRLGKDIPFLHFTESVAGSKALNKIRSGAIIISASGMCTAGRILHHLLHNLPRPECSVLITGFQAQGTLGRRLVDGAKQVRIFGQEIPVRAAIYTAGGGLYAHADLQALLAWTGRFIRPPRQTFVVHGEETAATDFANSLSTEHGWTVTVPEPDE
ncbi:MAG: MBL fold metallo-hydrolase, partial [Proteobacteria bacterium]